MKKLLETLKTAFVNVVEKVKKLFKAVSEEVKVRLENTENKFFELSRIVVEFFIMVISAVVIIPVLMLVKVPALIVSAALMLVGLFVGVFELIIAPLIIAPVVIVIGFLTMFTATIGGLL